MFSNANIYAKEWLDVIFADRNKSYGAYELRRLAPKATNIALAIVSATVLGISGLAYAVQDRNPIPAPIPNEEVYTVTVEEPDDRAEMDKFIEQPKVETVEQPQQLAKDIPSQDLVKFTEINATDASEIIEDVVETSSLLETKKLPGNITMDGVKGGTLIAKGTFGKTKREGGERGITNGSITGSGNGDSPFNSVEIMPEPVGGMKAFVQWVADNYNFPQGAVEAEAKGVIVVKFVVETDGSLTAFDVVRDMGYGTGVSAVTLLKRAKKWNPGIQNGRPVRVAFTLPIRLQVQQQ